MGIAEIGNPFLHSENLMSLDKIFVKVYNSNMEVSNYE